jgi:hypothetical protein
MSSFKLTIEYFEWNSVDIATFVLNGRCSVGGHDASSISSHSTATFHAPSSKSATIYQTQGTTYRQPQYLHMKHLACSEIRVWGPKKFDMLIKNEGIRLQLNS